MEFVFATHIPSYWANETRKPALQKSILMKTYPPWNSQQKHLRNGWLEYDRLLLSFWDGLFSPAMLVSRPKTSIKLSRMWIFEEKKKSTENDAFGSPSVCKTTGSEVACSDPIVCLGRLGPRPLHTSHIFPWCAKKTNMRALCCAIGSLSKLLIILGDKLIPPLIENHDNLYLNPYFWGLWPSFYSVEMMGPPSTYVWGELVEYGVQHCLKSCSIQYTVILWKDN